MNIQPAEDTKTKTIKSAGHKPGKADKNNYSFVQQRIDEFMQYIF